MKSERNPLYSNRQRLFASRTAQLLRKTAVRATIAATVFGCTASAIAGDHDKAAVAKTPSNSAPKVSTVGRIKQFFETGQASWYGLKFQGRKTSSGEVFDMNALTCAHRSLPIGSWLRVTNLRNRKSVLVRVNDRGPMVASRIIDLSYAAAHAVGLSGTGKVKLERVNIADPEVARTMIAQFPVPSFGDFLPAR